MPIEIRPFGVGHRRPEGPPGTVGVAGQLIHSDERGVIAELAFARGGRIEPHSNPSATWFVVIEGGGWVQVGEESARVAAGEAVSWPAGVVHGAWTELSAMRAIVVEFASLGEADVAGLLEGRAIRLTSEDAGAAERGEGGLRPEPGRLAGTYDPSQGEPV